MKRIITILISVCFIFNIHISAGAMSPYVNRVAISGAETVVMRVGETITLTAIADAQGFNRAYMETVWGRGNFCSKLLINI